MTQLRAQRRMVQRIIDALLDQAAKAARAHDQAGLYKVVHRLGPKAKRTRLQLRDDKGCILTKEQEMQKLQGHFTEVYRSAERAQTPVVPMPEFTVSQVGRCLRLIPARKATPHHCVPSIVWKISHQELAPYLQEQLRRFWSADAAQVPQLWRDAWFALLPKPSRPCKQPSDLRPIALQCSLGKAAIKLLCEEVRPYVVQFLQHTPQFAYCRGRDVQMALLRALSHFDQVRADAAEHVDKIHNRHQGRTPRAVGGAITLSLDLEQAFDRLPRSLVIRSLMAARVPAHLIHLVDVWHRNASYHLSHGGLNSQVSAQQGVRQGCLLAPLLFACATGLIVQELPSVAGPAWRDVLTIYADDFLGQEWVHTVDDIGRILQRWGTLVDCLYEFGLRLSKGKSVILARIGGSKGQAAWRKFLVKTEEGWQVRLPSVRGNMLIALKEEHKYLGAMVSYKSYEASTFQYRLQQARAQYGRLKKFLHSRQHLTLAHRVHMYRTCVWSTLSYALHMTGLGPMQVAKIRGTVATHLRAIARSPRHLTGETSESLHARLGFPDAMQQLCTEMTGIVGHIQDSMALPMSCPSRRHVHVVLGRLKEQLRLDQRSHVRLVQVPTAHPVACSYCGLYFPNERALRTHIGQKHASLQDVVRQEAATLSRDQYSIGSLPTCRFCTYAFCSWQRLHAHIRNGRCSVRLQQLHALANVTDDVQTEPVHSIQVIGSRRAAPIAKSKPALRQHEAAAPSLPGDSFSPAAPTSSTEVLAQSEAVPFVQRFADLRRIADSRYEFARNNIQICGHLKQHCCLCLQWVADTRRIKQHHAQTHPELNAEVIKQATDVCATFASSMTVPCPFCGGQVNKSNVPRHARMCTVLYQLAFICDGGSTGRSYSAIGRSRKSSGIFCRWPDRRPGITRTGVHKRCQIPSVAAVRGVRTRAQGSSPNRDERRAKVEVSNRPQQVVRTPQRYETYRSTI